MTKKTSAPTPQYNCIAWAFEDNTRWWWPIPRRYWPISYSGMTVMEAFEKLLSTDGWTVTANRTVESRMKKIALYVGMADGQPTHAARQLQSGLWTSKLGEYMDISHDLPELEGPAYGRVFAIYKKAV